MSSDAVGSCEKLCMAIKHLPSLAAGEKGGKLKKEDFELVNKNKTFRGMTN